MKKRKGATHNPLDQIEKASRHGLDDCADLASAMVVRTGHEQERHWDDSAETELMAEMAAIVAYGSRDDRTRDLPTMRGILSSPERRELAISLMRAADDWEGLLAQLGGQLSHFQEREKSSVISSALRHCRFLGSPAVADNVKTSSFDPKKLKKGKMTIYMVVPPDRAEAQAPLLRMWVSSFLRTCFRLGPDNLVHFVFDERPVLGHLECVTAALGIARSYGVRLHEFYQSASQATKCYPDGQEQNLYSNSTQIYFGINDQQTAELVSKRLGEKTIVVDSGGSSRGNNRGISYGRDRSSSEGSNSGTNTGWQQQKKNLLNSDEVIGMSSRTALTFTPGLPPIRTTLVRYYEEKHLGRRSLMRRFLAASSMLVKSAVLCALSVGLAMALANLVHAPSRVHQSNVFGQR